MNHMDTSNLSNQVVAYIEILDSRRGSPNWWMGVVLFKLLGLSVKWKPWIFERQLHLSNSCLGCQCSCSVVYHLFQQKKALVWGPDFGHLQLVTGHAVRRRAATLKTPWHLTDQVAQPLGYPFIAGGFIRENQENPTKMDDNWGYPYDSGNLHLSWILQRVIPPSLTCLSQCGFGVSCCVSGEICCVKCF